MKRIRTLDTALIVAVMLLIGFTLAPAVARLQRSPAEAKCQSNLRHWSKAMELYLADYYERYPTNRTLNGTVTNYVQLTPDDLPPADGKPVRFAYGANWVEALYPYIQASAAKRGQDWKSFRKCPNAQDIGQLPGGPLPLTSYVTYAFNYNLIEQPEAIVRRPASLMMLGEMDRRVNSVLRPGNLSPDGMLKPLYPFLTTRNVLTNPQTTIPNQHGNGSYIAFADGHVRYFTTEYYPDTPVWDSETQQWYNFVYPSPANDTERRLNKSIAITP